MGPGLVMGELKKRSEGGECWALTLLPCPSAGPGGGRPLLLPQRGGECSDCLAPGGAPSHWIPGQSELPGKGGVVWAGQAVVSGLGPVFMSLSHFMGATELPGRLGKQLLGPTPSFQSAKWPGLEPGTLLTSFTADAYPGKVRKRRRVQARPTPRSRAPGWTVTCHCLTLSFSLPICKMSN